MGAAGGAFGGVVGGSTEERRKRGFVRAGVRTQTDEGIGDAKWFAAVPSARLFPGMDVAELCLEKCRLQRLALAMNRVYLPPPSFLLFLRSFTVVAPFVTLLPAPLLAAALVVDTTPLDAARVHKSLSHDASTLLPRPRPPFPPFHRSFSPRRCHSLRLGRRSRHLNSCASKLHGTPGQSMNE